MEKGTRIYLSIVLGSLIFLGIAFHVFGTISFSPFHVGKANPTAQAQSIYS